MPIFRVTFFATFSLAAVLGFAACGSSAPKPHSVPAHSSAPAAASYPDVESLIAAMAVHGAVCANVHFISSSMPGGLSPHVNCSGASAGDTSVVVFTDHSSALAFAHQMIQMSANLGPVAEVVGPDWVVNTSPAFAQQVMSAVKGQLLRPSGGG